MFSPLLFMGVPLRVALSAFGPHFIAPLSGFDSLTHFSKTAFLPPLCVQTRAVMIAPLSSTWASTPHSRR
jgi:hypothetical protein